MTTEKKTHRIRTPQTILLNLPIGTVDVNQTLRGKWGPFQLWQGKIGWGVVEIVNNKYKVLVACRVSEETARRYYDKFVKAEKQKQPFMGQEVSILDKLGVDVGYKVSHTKTVTEADIVLFAGVSGDFNPVHVNEEYARKTFFGGRIAHGVIAISLISAAMAKLPGLVILMSHTSRFTRPVKIGDTITAIAEVTAVRKEKSIVTLKNSCVNQKGEVVVEGETVVRLFEPPAGVL